MRLEYLLGNVFDFWFSPNIYEIMEIFKYFHNNVVQFAHGFI